MNYPVHIDVQCPFCGEVSPVTVDATEGSNALIEDCTVCCHPIQLNIECEDGEVLAVDISRA